MNNRHCYSFHKPTLPWTEARELCKNVGVGYDLVVINDEKENQFVVNVIAAQFDDDKRFWIGLKKEETRNTFEWVDSSEIIYKNWDLNNPNMV